MILNHPGKGSVLSFGELLLRICPDSEGDWLKESQLTFHVGGSELNVASALALWGLDSRYFTALPDNEISKAITNLLQEKKIDAHSILYQGDRIGLYYLTQGKDLQHNALVYDRAGSSFSQLIPGTLNYEIFFEGVSWLHFSAICPAISLASFKVCLELLQAASQKKITISIDLNYRSRLWKYGIEPKRIMPELVTHCDLVMGNIWASETLLGIPVSPKIQRSNTRQNYVDSAKNTSEEIFKKFPKVKTIANTFRLEEENSILYFSTLYSGKGFICSKEFMATKIIDKVGSGDAYMAGLIYGYYRGWMENEILDYATKSGFKKLFIKGDSTDLAVEKIKYE